jgi:hypothetical protein
VNGEVVHQIRHYPAKLHFKVVVTNTDNVPSTALSVEDKVLESLGFKFTPAPPFTLAVGQSVTSTFEVTVKTQAECEALAHANSCTGEFDDVFKVIHDVGETDASARILCGPEKKDSCDDEDDDGKHDGDDEDSDADRDDDHHDVDDCGCREGGKKHGLGFWKVHEQALAQCVSGGKVDLGIAGVRTMADFEGVLWGSPEKSGDGHKRGKLDKERFLIARKLLVATCDVRVLGAAWEHKGEAEEAAKLVTTRKCSAMKKLELKLDQDRDCDGKHQVDAGPATPDHAKSIAVDPTRSSGEACEGGDDDEDEGSGK